MNGSTSAEVAVMFADIAGSTKLYESLGDDIAQALINTSLGAMKRIVGQHRGRVIKTIGDEVMCELPSADAGTDAAVAIQQHFLASAPSQGIKVRIRIGLHFGPILRRDDDIFGDAVNIAARMTAIAKEGQIIATDHTVERMHSANRAMTRHFDLSPVKGKSEAMAIYEILWEQDNVTAMVTSMPGLDTAALSVELVLECQGRRSRIGPSPTPFLIGREIDCDLQIPAPTASRHHARIEFRRGKYVLVDQSTNGTFVCLEHDGVAGDDIFLRREEIPLTRSGSISLGVRKEDAGDCLIRFLCG